MSALETGGALDQRRVRIYVVRLLQDDEGIFYGQVTEPATMRRWAFRGFEQLRRILEGREPEDPPPREAEGRS